MTHNEVLAWIDAHKVPPASVLIIDDDDDVDDLEGLRAKVIQIKISLESQSAILFDSTHTSRYEY